MDVQFLMGWYKNVIHDPPNTPMGMEETNMQTPPTQTNKKKKPTIAHFATGYTPGHHITTIGM